MSSRAILARATREIRLSRDLGSCRRLPLLRERLGTVLGMTARGADGATASGQAADPALSAVEGTPALRNGGTCAVLI